MNGIRADAHRTFLQRYLTDPLTAFLVFFIWMLLKIMPVDMASFVGSGLGWVLGKVWRKKTQVARHNLAKCFGQKTLEERERILWAMWHHLGRMMGEMPHMKSLSKRITIEGKDFVSQARDDGKGGFFCSAHFGNWEISGPVVEQLGISLELLYRAANNPWIEKYFYRRRELKGVHLIPKGTWGVRQMIQSLKNGGHIAILCDQKLREGISVPFFGYPAPTASAIAELSLKMDVPIYIVHSVREKGAHYRVIFEDKVPVFNASDKETNVYKTMLYINMQYEKWITANPEQYLWIHHRWPKSEYKK